MYILYELYRRMLISVRWAGITTRIIQPPTSCGDLPFPGTWNLLGRKSPPSLTCWARAELVVYTLQTHKVLTVCRSSNRKLTEIQARLTIRRPAINLCQNRSMSRVWVFCSMRSSISLAILYSLLRLSVHLLCSYLSRALNLHLSSSLSTQIALRVMRSLNISSY